MIDDIVDALDQQIAISERGITVGDKPIPGVIASESVAIRPGEHSGEWLVELRLVTYRAPLLMGSPGSVLEPGYRR